MADDLSPHWLWLAVPFVLAILLAAMLPPLDFDVREYHLQAPKEFFQQGRITFLPHNVYANMTLGTEMLSLLAMVLTGDWWLGALVGKTVIAAFTPLTAWGCCLAGRRIFTPTAGWWPRWSTFRSPGWSALRRAGLSKGPRRVTCFLPYTHCCCWPGRGRPHNAIPTMPSTHVFAAGRLSAGGAVATKYPAVLFVLLPLALWVLFSQWRMKPRFDPQDEVSFQPVPVSGRLARRVAFPPGRHVRRLNHVAGRARWASSSWPRPLAAGCGSAKTGPFPAIRLIPCCTKSSTARPGTRRNSNNGTASTARTIFPPRRSAATSAASCSAASGLVP